MENFKEQLHSLQCVQRYDGSTPTIATASNGANLFLNPSEKDLMFYLCKNLTADDINKMCEVPNNKTAIVRGIVMVKEFLQEVLHTYTTAPKTETLELEKQLKVLCDVFCLYAHESVKESFVNLLLIEVGGKILKNIFEEFLFVGNDLKPLFQTNFAPFIMDKENTYARSGYGSAKITGTLMVRNRYNFSPHATEEGEVKVFCEPIYTEGALLLLKFDVI